MQQWNIINISEINLKNSFEADSHDNKLTNSYVE